MARRRKPAVDRFWAKVIKPRNFGCWLWNGGLHAGYGTFCDDDGRKVAAHRFAWELYTGLSIPKGLCVLHSCDVRCCVTEGHLRVGTRAQNNVDRMIRNRAPRGEAHRNARLKEADVVFIRETRLSTAELARLFGVGDRTIAQVRKGRTWRHLLPKAA